MRYDTIIVGGGISGLSALHYIKRHRPAMTVRLFEGADRLGGVIGTDIVDNYACEWGPNGILDRSGLTRELCEEIGAENLLESANESAKKRFILRGGKLRQAPMSALSFITSGVLSPLGKLRIFLEPFTSSATDGDESIYSFAARHLGKEVAEYLVQPMVTGIYAGSAERLSVRACFPLLYELDRESGSIIRGALARRKRKKQEAANDKSDGGKSGRKGSMRLLSLKRTGVQALIERLTESYADCIRTGCLASEVVANSDKNGFTIHFENEAPVECDNLILAIPSYRAERVLTKVSSKLAAATGRIPYAPIAVVCLGYSESAAPKALDGFGFLIPPSEKRDILGAIWTSSIFPDRAPEGKVLLRVLLGGGANPEVMDESDESLVTISHNQLSEIMGVTEPPEMSKLYRWIRAIPQYTIGHMDILAEIDSELARLPGLYLAGNAYRGIGVSDCLENSLGIVESLPN
jgi:protoporphyrinogen/coproporphyrinogen III oxidase